MECLRIGYLRLPTSAFRLPPTAFKSEPIMKTLILFCALGILCQWSLACAAAPTEVRIAAGGKARCAIVTQPRAAPAEGYAARELAAALHQASRGEYSLL